MYGPPGYFLYAQAIPSAPEPVGTGFRPIGSNQNSFRHTAKPKALDLLDYR